MRHLPSILAACLLSLGFLPSSLAQTGTTRLIVPSPAGGVTDGLARTLGAQLRAQTGDNFIVENKPGASTSIGMRDCGQAKPDGRTYCITLADSLSFNPHAFANLSYDPDKFIGVAHLGASNALILANPRAGISTYSGLLAGAKKEPGRILWATFGDASLPDVIRRWTNLKAGVEIAGVPYRGFAPASQALLGGETHVGLLGIGASKAHVASGALVPIAVVGKSRTASYPSVPTLEELGLDMGLPSYFGIYAPPGTPPDVVEKMHGQVQKALDSEALRTFFTNFTLDRVDMSQSQFDQFIRRDRRRAGDVFNTLGIKPGAIPQ